MESLWGEKMGKVGRKQNSKTIFIDFLPCAQHCDRLFKCTHQHHQMVILSSLHRGERKKPKPKKHKFFVQDHTAMMKVRCNPNHEVLSNFCFIQGQGAMQILLKLPSIPTSPHQPGPCPWLVPLEPWMPITIHYLFYKFIRLKLSKVLC